MDSSSSSSIVSEKPKKSKKVIKTDEEIEQEKQAKFMEKKRRIIEEGRVKMNGLINEFDSYLINDSIDLSTEPVNVPIIEYMNNIRNKYYPDMDISFMEFFMSMVKDKRSINADKLAEYGVLSIKSNRDSLDSTNIRELLDRLHLINGKDYTLRQKFLAQLSETSYGIKYSDVYLLSPKAFKRCLLSSQNENKYVTYYLFLEECIVYYDTKQREMLLDTIQDLKDVEAEQDGIILEHEETIEKKDDEIFSLKDMVERLDLMIKKSEDQHREAMDKADRRHKQAMDKLDTMNDTLNRINSRLTDCAHIPSKVELSHRFALMRKNSDTFYVIRTQKRKMDKAIADLILEGYTKVHELLDDDTVPCSVGMWNAIKDVLVKDDKISCRYNEVKLLHISEQNFIKTIQSIFDSRKDY